MLVEKLESTRAAYEKSLQEVIDFYETTEETYKLKLARKELAALLKAPRPQYVTVAEALERYLQSTRLHCRPRTLRTSEAVVRRRTEVFGHAPAAGLSRTDVDRYTAKRLAQGVGPHTPNRALACLRAALTQAKDDRLIDRVQVFLHQHG